MNKGTTVQFNRQSSIIMSASSPTSAYEKDLKVDKRILEIMISGGNATFPSSRVFFGRIIDQTNVKIEISSSFRDRQGNEIPVVKVKAGNIKNLEAASALIMEHLDPHRDKMTFNIDVPYNDHSYIIGKDGSRIKLLSRETGCHIHLPDCNKTSGKKSNKLSIAGTSFESIEQARNQIRKSLPLNVGFKAKIKSRKFVHIDTASSEVQAIKRKYRVDVTFTNVISSNKYPEVTINVKGGRSQLEEIKCATHDLYQFVTGEEIFNNPSIDFTILIDISHSHHQYVKGKNNCNLKVIHQRSKSVITFPPMDSDSNQVLIQGKDLLSTVMGWQELMGYLPLLLSFDVNFDISRVFSEIQRLEKEYGVGIRTREKLSGHVYTVLIKTQERHSICLQEIRQRIIDLKTKADKINDENSFYGGTSTSNTNSFKNYLSENGFSQMNYFLQNNSSKSFRFSSFFGDTASSFNGFRPLAPTNRKQKESSKPFLTESNIFSLTNLMPDYMSSEMMTNSSNKSNANITSISSSIIDSSIALNSTYDPFKSNEKSIDLSSTANCESSFNASFDSSMNVSETTITNCRPSSIPWDPLVSNKCETNLPFNDYSFSPFNYSQSFYSESDSAIGSSLFSSGASFDTNEMLFNRNTTNLLSNHLENKTRNPQPVIN